MVTKSKLKMALLAEKGVNIKKVKQDKKVKAARKEKAKKQKRKVDEQEDWEDTSEDGSEDGGVLLDGGEGVGSEQEVGVLFEVENSDVESSSAEKEEEDEEDSLDDNEEEEDIPISDLEDLSSSEKEDIIPHQRLTINNTAALTSSLKRIALPLSTLPFSNHQCLVSSTIHPIPDISDDLTRELAFYSQSLSAAQEARSLLKKEGVPFSRPKDYFAEMVKADEHMERIKRRLIDEAAAKKASAEARKQRDLKRFGKQVQVERLRERDKEKRDTLEKIKVLKRKRQSTTNETTNEADLFDIALDEETQPTSMKRKDFGGANKRQKKDEKFGFGGKKKFKKSGDAVSSGDLRGFSSRKMKGVGKKQRPGKARRAGGKK